MSTGGSLGGSIHQQYPSCVKNVSTESSDVTVLGRFDLEDTLTAESDVNVLETN